ncbi:MAG: outer membrane beta-barrel protein [Syntrophales bacterium]|nr:outer membrane beta-barrel protein [Syntrophales bacterium]
MKRLFLFTLIGAFVMASSAVYAAEKVPLGNSNVAVKLGSITFTDNVWEELDVDNGLYVGLEGYGKIAPNLYLGMEIGYANPDDNYAGYRAEVTFVPVELNLKYAVEAAPNLTIGFGAGVSSNYAKVEVSDYRYYYDQDDWLFGGQFFADLNYKRDQFFVGINGKYQATEDFKNKDVNFNNWRIGAQVGLMF